MWWGTRDNCQNPELELFMSHDSHMWQLSSSGIRIGCDTWQGTCDNNQTPELELFMSQGSHIYDSSRVLESEVYVTCDRVHVTIVKFWNYNCSCYKTVSCDRSQVFESELRVIPGRLHLVVMKSLTMRVMCNASYVLIFLICLLYDWALICLTCRISFWFIHMLHVKCFNRCGAFFKPLNTRDG